MLLRDALKKLKYDKRLQEYNIQKGFLSQDELSSHITSLDDCQSASEPLRFKEERQQKAEAPAPEPQTQSQGQPSYGEYNTNGGSPYGNSDEGSNGAY